MLQKIDTGMNEFVTKMMMESKIREETVSKLHSMVASHWDNLS